MKIITAPQSYNKQPDEISVFLAGGITNCPEWQNQVISKLEDSELQRLVVYNPRQEHFDISDKNASYKQIDWEYRYLETMDIFSIYFSNGNSDQPICMYELGRNIVRMQNRFPTDWENRIVISVEDGYRRKGDVLIQTELATQNILFVHSNVTPDLHAQYIKRTFETIG